jgi:WD40 repeat protein/tRNA A-37 threonylcarbamoyl transferase component Bud32
MHILCPHCRNPIEVVKLSPREEITCPSCGSSFHVETDSTTGWELLAGRKLGKYEVLESVGQGAFGTVYKARDPELDRVVAVKVPRSGNLAGPQERDRFVREARSAAQLRHPSIVSVHDVGEVNGVPYLVSDFVEGVTLADLLSARRPAFREAAELVASVADALQYAHERGVVHRDVKPSNVMLGKGGAAFVMDFGLAKREAGEITMTVEGQVLGTPAYMPPEQARGEGHAVDGRGDVYSLGVVLYQLLTGELPFRGTQRMLLHQVLHDEPRPPRTLNDHVPRDLETITLKAMAKEPGRRYQTARELADDLRRWLKGEAILARPVGRVARAWRWARRRPAVAGLSAAVVVLLVTGTAVAWYLAVEAIREKGRADTKAAEALESARLATEAGERADARAAESYEHLYKARMNLAQAAHQRRDMDRVRELLRLYDPPPADRRDPRGWEWYYLRRACDPQVLTLRGHREWVEIVALSLDGKLAASADVYGNVKLWDATTGKLLRGFNARGESRPLGLLAFSPDGTRLVSVAAEYGIPVEVKVWDPADARLVQEWRFRPEPAAGWAGDPPVAVTPDLTRLAVAGSRGAPGQQEWGVAVWDLATGRQVAAIDLASRQVSSISLSSDGRRLATIGNETAQVWDVDSGEELFALWEPGRLGLPAVMSSPAIAISPDGKTLATTCGPRNQEYEVGIWLWDAQTGRARPGLLGYRSDRIKRMAFSPCGRQLAVVGDLVYVWELAGKEGTGSGLEGTLGGRLLRTILAPDSSVSDAAFSAGCDRLALASRYDRTVRIIDAVGGDAVRYPGYSGGTHVAYSRDGQLVAIAGHGQLVGDIKFYSVGDNETCEVRVWDTATRKELHRFTARIGKLRDVALSRDNRLVAAGGEGGMRVWNLATGEEVHALGHPDGVGKVAFSPDGRQIASIGFVQLGAKSNRPVEVKLRDAVTGRELRTLAGDGALAYSPDGALLATSGADHTVRLWESATGAELRRIATPDRSVMALAFSPDGRTLAGAGNASGPEARGEVTLWDAASGRELRTFRGHTKWVGTVCFSPDGRRLASTGGDDLVKVWDPAAGGEELLSLRLSLSGVTSGATSVAFGAGGEWLLAGGFDRVMAFDGRPFPPEFEVERQAHALVDSLRKSTLKKADLFDRARTDPATCEAAHRLAVSLLEVEWDDIARRQGSDRADTLWYELRFKDKVIAALRADQTLEDDVRRHALAAAEKFQEVNAIAIIQHSWKVVRRPDATPEEYADAHSEAELLTGLKLHPNTSIRTPTSLILWLNVVGVARYRVGRYPEAIEALLQSERANARESGAPLPADLAFLAMAYSKNGDSEKARAALALLRGAMQKPRWAKDPEAQGFLREAEAVVEGAVPKK